MQEYMKKEESRFKTTPEPLASVTTEKKEIK